MDLIKRIYGKVEFLLYYYISLVKIVILSIVKKNRIYLMGIPIHGNLGDQAIVISERKFLEENFKNYKIIEIESSMVTKKIKLLKKIVGNSLILIHGGGFIGTLWPKEDNMAKLIIKNMSDSKIILLPQTVYFENDESGREIIKQTKLLYEQHKNLHICLREQYSYNFMKNNFEKCNIYLVPDMVLYLKPMNIKSIDSKKIILCLRNDLEKTFSDINLLIKELKNNGYTNIEITDTVVNRRLYEYNRKKIVKNKIKDFNKSKLVITDRLHGMIFAFLANTPCLVINSKSHKVKGVYDWIKKDNNIKIIDRMDNFTSSLNEIFCEESSFDSDEFIKKYDTLINLIKDNIIDS